MRGTRYGWGSGWGSIALALIGVGVIADPDASGLGVVFGLAAIVVGILGIVKHGATYHVLAGILVGILAVRSLSPTSR
jgi:hypothetical protein